MPRQRRVVLIGNSLLMDGIAANVEGNESLKVIRVEPQVVDQKEFLESIEPDAIVFDLDLVKADSIFNLLSACPDIYLIGINSECNQVLVLNSSRHRTSTMHDLVRLVEDRVHNPEAIPG